METIIVFFRDTLSGTLYAVVSIICVILICVCLWQLIRRNKKARMVADEYDASHMVVINEKGERETVEVKPSINLNPGIVSKSVSLNGASTINTSSASGTNMQVPKSTNSKPVVMINPLEVANISSTMNVVGVAGNQKNISDSSNVTNSDNVQAQTNLSGTIVNNQQVSGLSNNSSISQNSGSSVNIPNSVNNQNFTN